MASQTKDVLVNFTPKLGPGATELERKAADLIKKFQHAARTENKKAMYEINAELEKLTATKKVGTIEMRTSIVPDARGGIKAIVTPATDAMNKLIKDIAKAESASTEYSNSLKSKLDGLNEKWTIQNQQVQTNIELFRQFNREQQQQGSPSPKNQGFGDALPKDQIEIIRGMRAELAETEKQIETTTKAFARFAPPASVSGKIAEMKQQLGKLPKEIDRSKTEFVEWGKVLKPMLDPIKKFRTEVNATGRDSKKSMNMATSGVEAFKASLNGVKESLTTLNEQSKKGFAAIFKGAKEANPEVKKLQKNVSILESGGTSLGRLKQMLKGVDGLVSGLMGPLGAALAVLGLIMGVINNLINRQKQLQGLKMTLDGVGVSMGNQAAIMANARDIALSYGVSLNKVEAGFKRLTPAILESGGSLKDTSDVLKSMAARTTMLGLNSEQAGRYMEAFAQVMGKGKLQGEELNQQFSELDGALRGQLAEELANGEHKILDLEKAMQEGRVTAQMFREAFVKINQTTVDKFSSSIDNLNKDINKLGEEGGQTISQFQQKINTLSQIGMDKLGQAFGPLGKELAKIYAAFVQIFTKIVTEMPGVMGTLKWLGDFLGRTLKIGLNTVLLAFGGIMHALDLILITIIKIYDFAKKIPVIGHILKAVEFGLNALNDSFDGTIDQVSTLSDETKGLNAEFKTHQQEIAEATKELRKLEEAGKKNTPAYEKLTAKIKKLEEALARIDKKRVQNKLKQQKSDLEADLKNEEDKLKRLEKQRDAEERKLEVLAMGLKRRYEAEKKQIKENIEGIEKEQEAAEEMFDKRIKEIEDESEARKRASEDAKDALKEEATMSKRRYEDAKDQAKDYYDQELKLIRRSKDAAQKKHESTIEELDEQEDAINDRYDAEEARIDSAKNSVERKAEEELKLIEEAKTAIEDKAEAELTALEEGKTAAESLHESRMAQLEQARSVVESMHDRAIANIKQEEDKLNKFYDNALSGIDAQKEASKTAHDAAISSLDAQLERQRRLTDEAIKRIDAERAASQEKSNLRIAKLEDLTPAEKALKEIELQKLRIQANDRLASEEERLRAQASLERMEREELISKEVAREKERQAKLEKEAAKVKEEQIKREEQINLQKKRLQEEEEARQIRLIQREKELQAQKETQLANLAAQEKRAAAEKESALLALERKQEQYDLERENALNRIDQLEKEIAENKDNALEELDGKATQIEDDRETAINNLDAVAKQVESNRKKALEELEEQRKEAEKAKKEDLEKLEEDEKAIQEKKKNRLDELEDKRRDQKRNEEDRLTALDDLDKEYTRNKEDRIADLESQRDAALKKFKERIKEQEEKYGELEEKIADLETSIEDVKYTEDELTMAVNATEEAFGEVKNSIIALNTPIDQVTSKINFLNDQIRAATEQLAALNDQQSGSGDSDGTTTTTVQTIAEEDEDIFGKTEDDFEGPVFLDDETGAYMNDFDPLDDGEGPGQYDIDSADTDIETGLSTIRADNVDLETGEVYTNFDPLDDGEGSGQYDFDSPELGLAAGGPIGGGQRSIVNEFGQEGFLNARTGKMKAIKTRPWGSWTAPASGTVIPAHIWKTLKKSSNKNSQWQDSRIQTQMEPIDPGVSSNAKGMQNPSAALLAALSRSGGDSFSNNITIQSQNPTKSAGDIMVAMARMRHRR